MMTHNPGLGTRADFRGDLRASILDALEHNENAGESELELARTSGGSRAQVRSPLWNLIVTGRVQRTRAANSRKTRILLVFPKRVAGSPENKPPAAMPEALCTWRLSTSLTACQ